MTSTGMLDAALDYAKRGWCVFPLEELRKTPKIPVGDKGKGVHDATTDRKQIETWWSRWPNANIAIHAVQFWVLDVDPKGNGPAALDGLIRQYGPLPETLRQRSGSGGTHYLFTSPIGVFIKNRSGFYPGLDTRSYGGYIVGAPSETESGRYEWENPGTEIAEAPTWLLELVKDKREGFKQAGRSDTGTRDVDDASMAGYLFNGGFNEDEVFDILQKRNNDPNRRDVPLPTNEILKTVRSIAKRDIRTPAGLRQAIHENAIRVRTERPDIKPDDTWLERTAKSTTLLPKNVLCNAELALTHSPLFCNSLAFDQLRAEVVLTRNIIDPLNGQTVGSLIAGRIVDEHATREITALAQRLITPVTFSEDIIASGIQLVARTNGYHPVQDYLHGLVWDETPRIDTWLIDHLGVEDDEDGYARGVGRRWLISAVGRALRPGCKADCMLVIESGQQAGKSPALAALAGQEWFKDSEIDMNSKDKFSAIRGVWIYELAEFDQYKGQDAARIKSFLSSQYDTYRPAYGRSDVKQPRGMVFVGTTNESKYLVDRTGNKRFWPVRSRHTKFSPIRIDKLADARDQIWAEAVRAYYAGEPAFINTSDLMVAHEKNALDRHDTDDTWESLVLDYMESMKKSTKPIQTGDILMNAIQIVPANQGLPQRDRVRRILERNGYSYVTVRFPGKTGSKKTWKHKESQPTLGLA